MSDDSFEDLGFAKRFKAWIDEEVAIQVQKIAPRRRIAEVTAIDMDARRADVIYVGETGTVSLPFNLAVPAYVGQHVVVDGPPQDRSIVDLLGGSATEERLGSMAEQMPAPSILEAPRWDRDTEAGTHQSFSYIMRWNEDHNELVESDNMIFVPIRTRTAGLATRITFRVHTRGTTSSKVTPALYRRTAAGDLVLEGQGPTIQLNEFNNQDHHIDLDREVSYGRGVTMMVGLLSTGGSSRYPAIDFLIPPLMPNEGYTMARINNVTAVPTSLVASQLIAYNTKMVWAAFH